MKKENIIAVIITAFIMSAILGHFKGFLIFAIIVAIAGVIFYYCCIKDGTKKKLNGGTGKEHEHDDNYYKAQQMRQEREEFEKRQADWHNKCLDETKDSTEQHTETPRGIIIKPTDFTFDLAVYVYMCNAYSCLSRYDHTSYRESAFTCLLDNIPKYDFNMPAVYPADIRQSIVNIPVTNYRGITDKTPINSYKSFVAIDTETTGLNPTTDDIIEISAIKFEDFRPVSILHSYVKSRKAISAKITSINHITNDMVADAPTFSQLAPALQEFIDGQTLIAYNARFDIEFLHTNGLDLTSNKSKIFDVLRIARAVVKHDNYYLDVPDNFKLATVCDYFYVGNTNYHNATADALCCALLFVDFIKIYKDTDNIFTLIDPKALQKEPYPRLPFDK